METRTASRTRIREVIFKSTSTPVASVAIFNPTCAEEKPKRIVRQKRVCVPGVWVAA